MDQQAKTSDLSLRVPVEPFAEVGHIAARYNQVIDSFARSHHDSTEMLAQLYMLTAAAAGMAENHQFDPEALELDGLGDREDELGTLARVLQQLVSTLHQREQELTVLKAELNKAQQQPHSHGFEQGVRVASRAAIVELLTVRFGCVSPALITQLEQISNPEQLTVLLKEAAGVGTIEDFHLGLMTKPIQGIEGREPDSSP